MSHLWATRSEAAAARLAMILKTLIWGGCAICLMISMGAPLIIPLVYGDGFLLAIEPLRYLIWFLLPTLLNSVFAYSLIAIKQEQRYFAATLRGSIIALVVMVAAIYSNALHGAAIGVLLAELCIVTSVFLEFRKFLNPPFTLSLAAAMATSLVLMIIARQTGWDAVWLLPLYGAALLLAAVAMGDLRWRQMLRLVGK